jgi:hypothetical protein
MSFVGPLLDREGYGDVLPEILRPIDDAPAGAVPTALTDELIDHAPAPISPAPTALAGEPVVGQSDRLSAALDAMDSSPTEPSESHVRRRSRRRATLGTGPDTQETTSTGAKHAPPSVDGPPSTGPAPRARPLGPTIDL